MSSEFINGVSNLQLSNVSVKIPAPFANWNLWFAQVEASFQLSRISEESTKYFHLICNLQSDTLSKFQHLLDANSPMAYSKLKEAIIQDYNENNNVSLADVMMEQSLGDRRPTEALRQMQRHLQRFDPTIDANGSMAREIFLRMLPKNIQLSILAQPENNLHTLAQLADKITAFNKSSSQNITSSVEEGKSNINEISLLREEISALRRQITKPGPSELCFYHKTFGQRARKCQQPCSWSSKIPTQNQGNGQRFH